VERMSTSAPIPDGLRRKAIARLVAVGSLAAWLTMLRCAAAAIPAVSTFSPAASAAEPTTVCATHILVPYRGASSATTQRTSETALTIAREILSSATKPGADFDALAREAAKGYPDVKFEQTQPFSRGGMAKPFADTVFALKPGQVADWITTTPFGFHIVRRDPIVHCREILIAYQGASRATVARTKDEARRLVETVRAEALKPGADFAALARRYSDAPDAAQGGDIGTCAKGNMLPVFDKAAFALTVGEISPVIESRWGFHIIRRIE